MSSFPNTHSTKTQVLERARRSIDADPDLMPDDAVRASLAEHFHLSLRDGDGIFGGSDAAIALGYRAADEDDDLIDLIVTDLSNELATPGVSPSTSRPF